MEKKLKKEKNWIRLFAALLGVCLCFAAGRLVGYASSGPAFFFPPEDSGEEYIEDLSDTVWNFEEEGFLGFYSDGSVWVYDESGEEGDSGEYTWDGSSGRLFIHDMEYALMLKDGAIALTDCEDLIFLTQSDSLPALPPFETTGGPIAGTTWYGDVHYLTFFTDGRLSWYMLDRQYSEVWGYYEWDETTGTGYFYLEDTVREFCLTSENRLMVKASENADIYYSFEKDPYSTYLGEEYLEVPGSEEWEDSSDEGAYPYPGGYEYLMEGLWVHYDDSGGEH